VGSAIAKCLDSKSQKGLGNIRHTHVYISDAVTSTRWGEGAREGKGYLHLGLWMKSFSPWLFSGCLGTGSGCLGTFAEAVPWVLRKHIVLNDLRSSLTAATGEAAFPRQ
jgi:hypothetical protein